MTTADSYENVLTALCLWREARGQSTAAKAAILAVLRNRVADKRWPDTLTGVILQPKQFSSFNPGDPNASLMPNPKSAPDWTAWTDCCNVVDTPLTADPTGGATNYESCEPGKLPAWADASKMTTQISVFRFYRL